MHIEIDIIVLGIAIHIMWLMGLDKLGSLFLRKKKAITGQYIYFLGLLTFTGIFLKENYIVRAVIQQSLLVLFFFFIFCGNRWEKLGLSSILVAIWEFAWNGTDSVLSICTIIFANNKLLPFNAGHEPFITILTIAIPTVCIYLLFCRTKLAEGNVLCFLCTAGFDRYYGFWDYTGHCYGFKWQRGKLLEHYLQPNIDTFRGSYFICTVYYNMFIAAVWHEQADRVSHNRQAS